MGILFRQLREPSHIICRRAPLSATYTLFLAFMIGFAVGVFTSSFCRRVAFEEVCMQGAKSKATGAKIRTVGRTEKRTPTMTPAKTSTVTPTKHQPSKAATVVHEKCDVQNSMKKQSGHRERRRVGGSQWAPTKIRSKIVRHVCQNGTKSLSTWLKCVTKGAKIIIELGQTWRAHGPRFVARKCVNMDWH